MLTDITKIDKDTWFGLKQEKSPDGTVYSVEMSSLGRHLTIECKDGMQAQELMDILQNCKGIS